jgi:hypothetical protein
MAWEATYRVYTFAGDGGVSQHGGGEQGCGAAVAATGVGGG